MGLILAWLACATPPAPVATPPSPEAPVREESQGLEADLARVEAFYDTRATYERPLRATGFEQVPGLPNLSAATCAGCHAEIHAEWEVSVHAQAWVDRQYQAEIGKSHNRWLCLNCHTPLLTQQDRWTVGVLDDDVEKPRYLENAHFDAALRDEGITCAACHVRGAAIAGPGLGGEAPHPVVVDPGFRDGSLCLGCHQAEATFPDKTFVCVFQTGDEWMAGPYPSEGKGCVDCHMPAIERPAATGGPTRRVGRHWWRGAGIPKIAGRYPPPEANPPGLGLDVSSEGRALTLVYRNANAGHMLPSGDPERWVQLDVLFESEAGPVGDPWQLRLGQTWEWTRPPRKVADNRLAPRESRAVTLTAPEGAVRARITASSHRISEENAAYHHLGDYPRSVVTHSVTWPLE